MKYLYLTAAASLLAALSAEAHSVAFSENFNSSDWQKSVTLLELDHKAPLPKFCLPTTRVWPAPGGV